MEHPVATGGLPGELQRSTGEYLKPEGGLGDRGHGEAARGGDLAVSGRELQNVIAAGGKICGGGRGVRIAESHGSGASELSPGHGDKAGRIGFTVIGDGAKLRLTGAEQTVAWSVL